MLRTTQQLYLVVADSVEPTPALVLKCGSAAVKDLYGYSVVWQSTARTLSCVSQSHVAAAPAKLDLEPKTMATKARVRVVEEFRAVRAGGLEAADASPAPARSAFQLTVI